MEEFVNQNPTEVNFKSDFDFLFALMVCTGYDEQGKKVWEDVGFPSWDWRVKLTTPNSPTPFIASSKGGRLTNCVNDGGKIRIVCNSHGLKPGAMSAEIWCDIPDGIYPDGARTEVTPRPVGITLVTGATPMAPDIEIKAMLPFIKGEAFTYEDFTPEQLESFVAPAKEAAEAVTAKLTEWTGSVGDIVKTSEEAAAQAATTIESVNSATAEIMSTNEKALADIAEATRQAQELVGTVTEVSAKAESASAAAQKASADTQALIGEATSKIADAERYATLAREAAKLATESAATSDELAIKAQTNITNAVKALADVNAIAVKVEADSKEMLRAEEGRKAAENARAEAESARKDAEMERQSAEQGREDAEAERERVESARVLAEESREKSEQSRVKAEVSRHEAETSRQEAERLRSLSEDERETSETERESNEEQRIRKENARTTAEEQRQCAEEARQNIFNEVAAKSEQVVDNANKSLEAANHTLNTYETRMRNLEEDVKVIEAQTRGLFAQPELYRKSKRMCVGAWDYDNLSPDAQEVYGDSSAADCWEFVLVDCEAPANTDGSQPVVGVLKRDNIFRFKDGGFAPAVGITEEMRAECDDELYLDAALTQKVCEAGEFDAAAFYNAHGIAPLYNSQGVKVRQLLPWETTEKKYSVFKASTKLLYPIDRLVGDSGTEWSGVMEDDLRWDGLNVTQFKLAPTGITPSAVCTVGDKSRCFFFDYDADHAYCRGTAGQGGIITMFRGGTYPRCSDMHQGSAGTRARANNADPALSYPFAESGAHAFNVFNLCLEAKYGTKNLNAPDTWGTGISSNDACANSEQWLRNGGVRYRLQGEETWTYEKFNSTPAKIRHNNANGSTNWNVWLNLEWPKERCMEAQVAMSWATELGIAECEEFECYGGEYWYESVPCADTADMSVRVYRQLRQHGRKAYSPEGEEVTFDVEVMLRMSLYDGVTLSGDIFSYNGGGSFLVGLSNGTTTNNEAHAYLQPDQRKWGKVATVYTDNGDPDFRWDFEDTYIDLGTYTQLGNNQIRHRMPWTSNKLLNGGTMQTGECAYNYDHNYWGNTEASKGKRYLVGERSRLYASLTICSRRSVNCSAGFPNSIRYICASAQVLLAEGWCNPDAVRGEK